MATISENLIKIAENQQEVYQAGYQKGLNQNGYDVGYADHEDAWWESYQNGGKRTDYQLAFGGAGWTDENFKPKYNFNLISGNGLTSYMMFRNTKITDLSEYSFKFQNGQYIFSNSSTLKKIGDVHVTSSGNLYGAFDTCTNLEEIKSIRFEMTSGNFVSCFTKCNNLVNVGSVTGSIKGKNYTVDNSTNRGYNYLNISAATKLNKSSIINFMQALDDTQMATNNVATKRISFSPDAVNKAFETSEGANDGLTSPEWLALVAAKPTWTVIV